MNWWAYGNWFRSWGWAVDIDPTKLPKAGAPTGEPFELTDPIAGWIVAQTRAYHRQSILLPHSDAAIRSYLKRFELVDYWFIEPDGERFRELCLDETIERSTGLDIYKLDTMWNQSVTEWVDSYEPDDGIVDRLIMNGPADEAVDDLKQLLPFVLPFGLFAATVPIDALRDDVFRVWCGVRDIEYHIPLPAMLVTGSEPYAILTGTKQWEER